VNCSASKRLCVGACCNWIAAHAQKPRELKLSNKPLLGVEAISERKVWSALGGVLEVPIWASQQPHAAADMRPELEICFFASRKRVPSPKSGFVAAQMRPSSRARVFRAQGTRAHACLPTNGSRSGGQFWHELDGKTALFGSRNSPLRACTCCTGCSACA
jgi:hypothetical protein